MDIKYTDTVVEVYLDHQSISSHPKFPNYIVNSYDTAKTDMPDEFSQPEMDDERMRSWASTIGSGTLEVINRIFCSVQIKEQGYNAALSVLKLSKSYSHERFEIACKIGLMNYASPRYKHLKAILSNNQNILYAQQNPIKAPTADTSGAFVRGAEYYGGKRYDQ